MVYLAEGVLSPEEVRLERGMNPTGVVEIQNTEENVNVSGGKDEDKKEESKRTENRTVKKRERVAKEGNKPAANVSGDRKKE
jgi:hypothetical protein